MSIALFHGWGTNKNIFKQVETDLLPYQAVSYDLPGHGMLSDLPLGIDEFLLSFVKKQKEPVHLIGWSLGGIFALKMAYDFPQYVRSLVLVSTFVKYFKSVDYQCGLKYFPLEKTFHLFEQDYCYFLKEFLLFQCMGNEEQKSHVLHYIYPYLIEYYNLNSMGIVLKNLIKVDYRYMLIKIKIPCLLVYGKKDRITPPDLGQFIADQILLSRMEIMENSAHIPFFSEYKKFILKLHQFYQTIRI